MINFKKFLKDERGSSVIIEMAFITIIMVMILYGFIMFANALSLDLAIKTAAREGAREYAISGDSYKGINKAKEELATSKVNGADVTSFTEGAKGRGIKIVKSYEVNIPFAGTYGPTLSGVGLFIQEPPKSD